MTFKEFLNENIVYVCLTIVILPIVIATCQYQIAEHEHEMEMESRGLCRHYRLYPAASMKTFLGWRDCNQPPTP